MYIPPIFKIPERAFPIEKRKAIVRRRIENAQGLTLSIRAATPTRGRRNFPSPLMLQSVAVPTFPPLKKITDPKSKTASAIRIANFLLIFLRGYRGAKLKLDSLTGVVLDDYYALNFPYSGGAVRRGLENDLDP